MPSPRRRSLFAFALSSATLFAAAALGACDNSPPPSASSMGAPPPPRSTPAQQTPPAPQPAHPASPPMSAHAEEGKQLFGKYCALCHGPEGKGYAADNAPSLVSESFLKSATDQFIAMGTITGRPGTAMAPYGAAYGGPLTDEQVLQIVSFLRSKGPAAEPLVAVGKGNPEAGKPLFEAMCATCHSGHPPKRTAPRLDLPSFLHIATDSFIDYAIRIGRPGTPMEAFGNKLKQSQINDIIAYLRTFQNPEPTAILPPPTGKEPMVINPKGKQAAFTLRDDRFVPSAEVAAALAAKRRLVILDARPVSDWRLGHIPGAIQMPYYEMVKDGTSRIAEIPKDGTWVLAYCACPHHASGEVIDELRRRGYPKTAIIDEGILFWGRQGYPMTLPKGKDGKPVMPKMPDPHDHSGHDHSHHGHGH